MTKRNDFQVLFNDAQIAARVKELGAQISEDYRGKEIILIAMLKGSLFFLADLCRALEIPCKYDVIGIGHVPNLTRETGIVRITRDLELEITDRHVLVIEEVVRTGLTTNFMLQHLESRQPASLKLCALLANPDQLLINLPLSYVGFEIDYTRVVGYGMDYREQDRQHPFIATLDKSRYTL